MSFAVNCKEKEGETMPRVILGAEERIRAARQNNMRRKVHQLEQLLATVKHKVGYDKIRDETGYAHATVSKIINRPQKATVEQLLAVSDACGIDLVIIEKQPQYENCS